MLEDVEKKTLTILSLCSETMRKTVLRLLLFSFYSIPYKAKIIKNRTEARTQ